MTPLENRTREALHEVADGLLVTDTDLHRIEEDLMTLLDTRSRGPEQERRRRMGWAAAAVAGLVLVGSGIAFWRNGQDAAALVPAAPVPAAPVPTAAPTSQGTVLFDPTLVGLWRNGPSAPWLWQFTADGRISWDDSAQKYLYSGTSFGRVTARDGDVYDISRGDGCVLSMRFRVTGSDTAVASVVDDSCADPSEPESDFELVRVSGRDPSAAPLRPAYPARPAARVTSIVDASGSWFEPVTGTLLVLGSTVWGGGVSYLVDDDGDGVLHPDQRGTVTMTPSGATVPVPSRETPNGCAPVFTQVTTTTATMMTAAGAGGCFREGSTQTWVALN